MRGCGGAVASQEVENDEAAEDGGAIGRIAGEHVVEPGVNGARGGVAMTVQEFGVGAEGRRVLGRRFHRLFQALQCLKRVAFAFQLPDFAGGILRGNSPSGKAKANHNPREPHRSVSFTRAFRHPSLKAYGFLLYH